MEPLLNTLPTSFDGPKWFVDRRVAAAAALRDHGLPGRKTEAWRFTPVRSLVKLAATGHRVAELRSPVEGVQLRRMAETLTAAPDLLAPYLQDGVDEHFAALNTAVFTDGLWLHIEEGAQIEEPLWLDVGVGCAGQATHVRTLVTVGAGASVTLVEDFSLREELTATPRTSHVRPITDRPSAGDADTVALTNAVTEVRLGTGARMEHVRLHEDQGSVVGRLDVVQQRDSRFASTVLTLGGALLRLDLHVALRDRGAECDLRGAYLAESNEHVDHHTRVEHVAPHCSSRQNYRGIVGGEATAVFDGIVVVHRDAQRSEAHQENRNLLLSDTATVHTKPHLEIDADDVVCSHGATVGTLDRDQLFYLRSRGVDEAAARALLTRAFVSEIVDSIPSDKLRVEVSSRLASRIPHSDLLEASP